MSKDIQEQDIITYVGSYSLALAPVQRCTADMWRWEREQESKTSFPKMFPKIKRIGAIG